MSQCQQPKKQVNSKTRRVQGLLVSPEPGGKYLRDKHSTDSVRNQWTYSYQDLLNNGLSPLPLAQSLGVPLACVRMNKPDRSLRKEPNALVDTLKRVYHFHKMSQNISAEDHEELIARPYACGMFLIVRYDGRPLATQVLEVIIKYIDEEMPGIDEVVQARSMEEVGKSLVKFRFDLNPDIFKEYWEGHVREMRKYPGDREWWNIECPVVPGVGVGDRLTGGR